MFRVCNVWFLCRTAKDTLFLVIFKHIHPSIHPHSFAPLCVCMWMDTNGICKRWMQWGGSLGSGSPYSDWHWGEAHYSILVLYFSRSLSFSFLFLCLSFSLFLCLCSFPFFSFVAIFTHFWHTKHPPRYLSHALTIIFVNTPQFQQNHATNPNTHFCSLPIISPSSQVKN